MRPAPTPSCSPAATVPQRRTAFWTPTPARSWSCPAIGTPTERRTARAAPTPRRSPRTSRWACRWPTRPVPPVPSPRRPCATACASSARGPAPSTSSASDGPTVRSRRSPWRPARLRPMPRARSADPSTPRTDTVGGKDPSRPSVLAPMTPHELMTDYLAAAHAGDWDAAFGLLADDLVLRIPGRSPQAGLHHGKAAAIDYIATIRARYGPGQIELEVIDMLVGNERVVLLVEER